jgi:hypothetical protein
MTAPDLTGRSFGRYVALARGPSDRHGKAQWWAECACGTVRLVRAAYLLSGHTTSCGCRRIDVLRGFREPLTWPLWTDSISLNTDSIRTSGLTPSTDSIGTDSTTVVRGSRNSILLQSDPVSTRNQKNPQLNPSVGSPRDESPMFCLKRGWFVRHVKTCVMAGGKGACQVYTLVPA